MQDDNPYKPPKSDSNRYDRYNEDIYRRPDDETDWVSFFWIVLLLFTFTFHRALFDFFVEIFRNLLYN